MKEREFCLHPALGFARTMTEYQDLDPSAAEWAQKEESPIFRPAEPKEDGMLSRILCNAFLLLWLA